MDAASTVEPLRRKGKKPRARALSNEEVWRRLLEECSDVHPYVMRWCGGDEGLAWEAMFYVGQMWEPDAGASFRTYVRSWGKHIAHRMFSGGKKDGTASKSYAILTKAQRTFGEEGGDDLLLQDVLPDRARAPDFGFDYFAALREALAGLSERDRMVIEARYFRHATLRAVAERQGVTVERVRQVQLDALDRLHDLLVDALRSPKTGTHPGLRRWVDFRS